MRTLLAILALACSTTAELLAQTTTVQKSFELLQATRIPEIDLKSSPFSEAYKLIEAEWQKIHPETTFPLALVDFAPPGEARGEQLVTLKLKNTPFSEALIYVAKAAGRKISEDSGLLKLEHVNLIVENWRTRVHPVNKAALAKLGLKKGSSKQDVRKAYEKFGIKLDDWMEIALLNDRIVLLAFDHHHSYVSALHFFLESGFMLSRDPTSTD
jgi:hypothetical protein